jgi:ABC-2 type transport system ATP-binding protein
VAPAIEAIGLSRSFGDQQAVRGVDISVAEGEIYGFLGPNGAGKSTTVRMLCTLLVPSGGTARILGRDVVHDAAAVRLSIGVALQDAALDDKQSGRELLRLQGRLFGLSVGEIDRRLRDLAALIDIGEALERRIGTYSGGMKRRLDLAAALMHNPRVLFLDEPSSGLDPVSRARVWDEVRRLNRELGMTIFLTTQYLEEADELAGRVAIIDRGVIVGEGAPSELKRRIGADMIVAAVPGATDAARLAVETVAGVEQVSAYGEELAIRVTAGDAVIGPVAVALHDAGIAVRSLTLRTPTLDDVFLELTGGHFRTEEP